MKGLFYGAASLLAIASAIAVPASLPETDVASSPVEERNLFKLWYPGYKPYKYKFYCPGKPVHDKYLCEKPGKDDEPSYLGWKGYDQKDFEYYLDYGYNDDKYGYKEYSGGKNPKPDPKEVCLAGPKGYESICPVYDPPKYKFPPGWGYKYKEWVISPYYKFIVWLEITLKFFKQVHYWEAPQYYKWICYEDGKGGYDVKAWDGKYKHDKQYFECKIIAEPQYQKWGFSWY